MFRTGALPVVSEYLSAISRFCPLSKVSDDKGLLLFSSYNLSKHDNLAKEEMILAISLLHAEILRKERLINERNGNYLSENIIFESIDGIPEYSLDYAHWFLKLLYTEDSLLFGKFEKDYQEYTRKGDAIPVSPVNMITMRSATSYENEKHFFSATPPLLELLKTSKPSDRDILGKNGFPSESKLIDSLISEPLTLECVELGAKQLVELPLYDSAMNWIKKKEQEYGDE